jgi:hypothetical protein
LDAFSRGGRPAADVGDDANESESDDAEGQQRLDDVSDDGDLAPIETWGGDDADAGQPSADTTTLLSELTGEEAVESDESLHSEVDAAIKRLEALRGELE